METIHISKINSAGIAREAKAAGLSTVELIGKYQHPANPESKDWSIRLYLVGAVCVADTNGGLVWEEDDPAAFSELLKEYGVNP